MTVEKLGRWLREARKAKGSTLDEAEKATRIRAQFLEFLEAGDFAAFPGGDVQLRGFLRIYARYLDLSPEEVLGRYSAEVYGSETPAAATAPEETQAEPVEPTDDLTSIRFRPRDIPVSSALPRWMSVETVLIVGILLTVLLAVLAIVSYVMNQPENEQSLPSAATTAPTEIAVSVTTTPPLVNSPPALATSSGEEVTLILEATEHVLVRVERGTQVVFEDMMAPGQTETWSDDEVIVVKTGNGAGLQVTVNGQVQGTMCGRGEACTRAWGPTGQVAPP
jgi:cytoskeletal protein RodZ